PCKLAAADWPLQASHWRSPLTDASRAATHCGLAAGSTATFCNRLLTLKALAVVGRPCKGPGCGLLPLQVAWSWPATPVRGVAVVNRHCRGLGHGRSCPFLAAFVVKIQQECVERFYAVQSHHTQFKNQSFTRKPWL
ncbi:hypothetical protein BHM03_00062163, partial [Ensete ventricosum]